MQYEGFEWNEGGGTEGSGDKEGEGVLFDEDFDENNYPGRILRTWIKRSGCFLIVFRRERNKRTVGGLHRREKNR